MPASANDNRAESLSFVRRLFPTLMRCGTRTGPFPESLNPVIIFAWMSYPGESHGSVDCLAHRRFVVEGAGFGLIGNIVVGILGSIVAGFLFPVLGIHIGSGLIGSIIHAAIGAIVLLFVLSLIRRA
jgi:uncharacterized membrane protein YeaQ/YmgE (transglycosylase-associated protein family)